MVDDLPPLTNKPLTFPGLPEIPKIPELPVYLKRDYASSLGRRITAFEHVSGPVDETCPPFIGTGGIPIEEMIKPTNGAPAQRVRRMMPVQVAIEASTIEEAFSLLDAAVMKAGALQVEAMKSDCVRRKLVDGLGLPPAN